MHETMKLTWKQLFFTEGEVCQAILDLGKKRHHGIQTEIIHALEKKITPCMTGIINACLKQGKVQNTWKNALQ